MNQQPLTVDEYEKLFRMLELISGNINRLFTQGVLLNEVDDEQIHSSQRKIEKYREDVHREQARIKRLREYLRRKKEQDRKRKSTSGHK